jgi:F-type H+-transporting ATPase subunit b
VSSWGAPGFALADHDWENVMRRVLISVLSMVTGGLSIATPAVAEPSGGNIMTPNGGLMIWTLVIFVILMLVLSRFAFKPITAAVAAREKALEDAIEQAKRDRAEAAEQLAEHRQLLERAHGEAQRVIADARSTGDGLRQQLLEQGRAQQQDLLERARKEIQSERDRALIELRRTTVDLAILGAGKVIEKNLDDKANRKLVDEFLAGLDSKAVTR